MNRDLSIIAQNAGTTAAKLLSSYYASPGSSDISLQLKDVVEDFHYLREVVFQGTLSLAAEHAVSASDIAREFDAVEVPDKVYDEFTPPAIQPGGMHGARPNEGFVLNGGKHPNQTLMEVWESDPSYIEWMGSDRNKYEFTRNKAQAFLGRPGNPSSRSQ